MIELDEAIQAVAARVPSNTFPDVAFLHDILGTSEEILKESEIRYQFESYFDLWQQEHVAQQELIEKVESTIDPIFFRSLDDANPTTGNESMLLYHYAIESALTLHPDLPYKEYQAARQQRDIYAASKLKDWLVEQGIEPPDILEKYVAVEV